MNIQEQKEILRKKFQELRKEKFEEYKHFVKDIYKNLFSIDELNKCSSVLAYYSKDYEVPTKDLIELLLEKNKIVALPQTDFKNKNLIPRLITKNNLKNLKKNMFGVLEPDANFDVLEPDKIDLVLVPGLVFDRFGYRLGYGYGFYDRFLQISNFIKIGLCFSFQVIKRLPTEKHDVALDFLVTQKDVIKIKK